ncbi:MAG TPA: endonuclease, partial [bacterium]|nr:endonuclease [bacterium]
MQFRLPALLALLTTWSAASAQTLTVSGPQISFGTTTELAPVARTLTVSNPTASPITVTDAHLFGTYGQPAFGVTPATFTVAPGGSQTITVTFAPLHNIAHNSELVLVTDRLGAVRVDLLGQGHYSRSYYNNTENLSEQALLDALKQITTAGHNALGYNTGRDRMFMTIDNKRVNGQGASVNTLECIYTGRQITGYTSRSAAQNQGFNTEHTWPQSLFSSANPMQSDLHHLFPTDDAANNSRSNNPFGIATQPYRNDNINAPSHLGNNNRYEPRDPQKGRTARAMLYFVTRYQNYSGYFNSQQSILRQWHHQFPVTQVDRRRNDDVLTAQGNRNPF